ncbi:hypothetical protein Tco_0045577 [Tanacetum coccineum]
MCAEPRLLKDIGLSTLVLCLSQRLRVSFCIDCQRIEIVPNGDALRKCILQGPYIPSTVIIPAEPATDDSPAVLERTVVETLLNMSPENKAHYQSEKEAIHLLLTGIGDEIYLTVDACKTDHDMWIAIIRLQQGESFNIQDVKTNLFWEFGKFTSHDGETMESYYSRFYKMMNEMVRNNLTIATMHHHRNQSSSTRSHASTRYIGKEISHTIYTHSEAASDRKKTDDQYKLDVTRICRNKLGLLSVHKVLQTYRFSIPSTNSTSVLLQTLKSRMWITFY